MGKVDIENRMEHMQADTAAKPLYISVRLGRQYDTRVGATSSSSGTSQRDQEDWAYVANASASWQLPLSNGFGFRLGYGGYADFHDDYDEYDIIDQTATAEPQWQSGNILYSLPVSYTYSWEDQEPDFYRYMVMPTVTMLFSGGNAVELYGLVGQVNDVDDAKVFDDPDRDLDEDALMYGVGAAYVKLFQKRHRIRLSVDYRQAEYDSAITDYGFSLSNDDRDDALLTTGVDVYFSLLESLGIYANYNYIYADSNVETYDYDRHIIEAGVAFRY